MARKKPKNEIEVARDPLLTESREGLIHEYMDRLRAALPQPTGERAGRLATGMHFDGQSKYVTWEFDAKKFPTLELLHITDVQFGHIGCRIHRVIEYRDWVLSKPNRFMLWGGDMIDAWAAWSPGQAWENTCSPQSQIYRFCEVWAPARHRVLGFVGGNHERRALPAFGDLGALLATILSIPYSSGKQLVDVHFGAHDPFKINLWHGAGSARTKGAKAQMIERQMQTGDSQLYLVGHLHDALALWAWRSLRKKGRSDVHMQKIAGAMSSSFLSHWGTYGEVMGLNPSDVMMARAVLEPDGKWELTMR